MKYTIETLDHTYVTIKVAVNGEKIMRTFCNSNYDRNELLNLIPTDLYNRILKVWGETATVADLPDPRNII